MKLISPGELAKGQFVTVHHWLRDEYEQQNPMGFGGSGAIVQVISQDGSYKGDVLEIIVVDLPFIAVVPRDVPQSNYNNTFKLDTRKAILMELSKEYVDCLIRPAK